MKLTQLETLLSSKKDLQYFSKHRNEWVDFANRPTIGELIKMNDFYYQLRIKP